MKEFAADAFLSPILQVANVPIISSSWLSKVVAKGLAVEASGDIELLNL